MSQPVKFPEPKDAAKRRAAAPVLVYPNESISAPNWTLVSQLRASAELLSVTTVEPRQANWFEVPAGHLFRITSIEGPQVGDLNLWHSEDLSERFFSGKTRALHATHVSTGDHLWSDFPNLRAMATITADTLDWYGLDDDGAGIHDVIGTRCDPYTNHQLTGQHYHHCCHSNLIRALMAARDLSVTQAEALVHDVLNVFMCTGFTRHSNRYFMKASPVRPGDYLELVANMDLLGALSCCPGGDCSTGHSSDQARCYPLKVEVFRPDPKMVSQWSQSIPSGYNRQHGLNLPKSGVSG